MAKVFPESPEQWDEGEPFSYVRTATTYGSLELILDWLKHHGQDEPDLVSDLVLATAAMYGQLEVLQHAISFGER